MSVPPLSSNVTNRAVPPAFAHRTILADPTLDAVPVAVGASISVP